MTAIAQQQSNPRRMRLGDPLFKYLTFPFAMLVLAILSGILPTLIVNSWPALRTFGPAFLWRCGWHPVTENFGALVPLVGTIETALIAMLIGVPFSFGMAFFLTEMCPHWLRQPIAVAIELLAAVPSIIYGIWGLFV